MILIHLERSDAMSTPELPAGRTTIAFDDSEGSWVQLTYDSLRTQDGAPLVTYTPETDAWWHGNEPYSDIVIEFQPPWRTALR